MSEKSMVIMHRIYLFTLKFPFGYGEAFLENEMAVASRLPGLEIILVPFQTGRKKRILPAGIKLDTSLARLVEANHEKKIFPLLLNLPKVINGIIQHKCKSFSALRDVAGVVHHGNLIRKWASLNLKNGDIGYTYWFDRATFGLARLKSEGKMNFLLVSRVHRYDLYAEQRSHGFIPFSSYVLNNVNYIFSISTHGQEYLINKFSKPVFGISKKIILSRLGVADHGVNPTRVDAQFIRVVSCSNIIRAKKVDQIAKLMINYAAAYPDKQVRWEHFGDGPLRENLAAQIQQVPSNLKVVLHGQTSNTAIMDFYRKNQVSAFVNLSDSEGVPVSIMEAQSFGIPVLAKDVGGVSEIVNNQNGYLMPGTYDLKKAVSVLDELVNNENKRILSRASFLQNYSAEQNYEEFYMALKRQLFEI